MFIQRLISDRVRAFQLKEIDQLWLSPSISWLFSLDTKFRITTIVFCCCFSLMGEGTYRLALACPSVHYHVSHATEKRKSLSQKKNLSILVSMWTCAPQYVDFPQFNVKVTYEWVKGRIYVQPLCVEASMFMFLVNFHYIHCHYLNWFKKLITFYLL